MSLAQHRQQTPGALSFPLSVQSPLFLGKEERKEGGREGSSLFPGSLLGAHRGRLSRLVPCVTPPAFLRQPAGILQVPGAPAACPDMGGGGSGAGCHWCVRERHAG